ncbi:hypothetical protein LDENG_00106890 [Lucifuga dentata]|nr:hypothetical protein LDENG_00106890 [Lucifuga dentata]
MFHYYRCIKRVFILKDHTGHFACLSLIYSIFIHDHTTCFACLSLIYSIFIHVTLLTIISQRIKPYFSFPDILLNLLIFQNQIFSDTPTLKIHVSPANSYTAL